MIRIADREYLNLQEALDNIPEDNKETKVIDLVGNVINDQIEINKPNIIIRNGIFDYGLGAYEILDDGYKRGTFRTYTVYVSADNVTFEDLSVLNSNGYSSGQAIALMIDGDNFKARNTLISSYQDTLFLGPLPETEYEKGGFRGPMEKKERIYRHAYFEDCTIEGSIDFIFGGGMGYFHNCEIRSLNIHRQINGYVCAPCTYEDRKYGFIFDECDFTSENDMEDSVYLARPWRDYGKCLIVNSHIGSHIRKQGYHDWDKPQAHERSVFKEYNNKCETPAERVDWIKGITDEDLEYINSLKQEEKR